MKRINSSYKLVEFLSGRGSGADTVVNVATIEFRFRAIVLIEKFVLDVAYERIVGYIEHKFFTDAAPQFL